MIPLCRDLGVGGNPYSPRARGFLTHQSRYADDERTARASNDPLAESMYGDDDLAVVAAVGAIVRCGFAAEHRSYARAVVSVNIADMPITEWSGPRAWAHGAAPAGGENVARGRTQPRI